MRFRILVSWFALVAAGCDGSPMTPDGGGPCAVEADCEDGQFCTGHACDPSAPGADARGCVIVPDYDPCDGATCDEAADVCRGPMNCDADGDGVESTACGGTDCDDDDPDRFPGNRERCFGELRDGSPAAMHDEDCNPCTVAGVAPDGDADADLYPGVSCVNPWLGDARPIGCDPTLTRIDDASMTVSGSDCNDDPDAGGESVRPNQVEVCGNRIDDNCDGEIDRAFLYPDVDDDGRGDADHPGELHDCDPGWVFNDDDCDDLNERTYLGARELCDRIDNDCSLPGDMAGGVDPTEDADDDGHAAIAATCLGPGEMGAPMDAFPRDDCDDAAAGTHPGAIDLCDDGIDQNCDGVIDNISQIICDDLDGDGHGNPSTRRTLVDCTLPMNVVAEICDDCDDGNDAVFPSSGTEPCDRLDNDCSAGGGADASEDVDRDGYAPVGASCVGGFPATDCNDTNADIHPGATEICDGVDWDCSSAPGPALDEDGDMDFHAPVGAMCVGRGEPGAPASAFPRDDCDDTRADVHGGRTLADDQMACDGRDNDCDPSTSELASTAGCANAGFCGEGGTCGRRLRVVDLDASRMMTCARYASGEVRCWGEYTTLFPLTVHTIETPVRVPALEGSAQLAVGEVPSLMTNTPSCALRNDGDLLCWTPTAAASAGPTFVQPVEIRLGNGHTCARLADGTVSCYGGNTAGQLGDGTTANRFTTPAPVPGLTDVRGLALGGRHSCALLGDGTVSCWGLNDQGQVGNGSVGTNALRPTPVVGLSGVRSIHAGPHHTCAVLASGQVRCWGANDSGQLGVPGPSPSPSPTAPIASLSGVAMIDASLRHTCAVLTDGRVMCWGDNAMGALGDGTTTSRSTPAAVLGVAGAVDVALEDTSACSLSGDGLVRCWGDGVSTPAIDDDLRGVVATAASPTGTCAVEASGALWCWGANDRGQLGDGTRTASLTPIPSGEGVLPAAHASSLTLSRISGVLFYGHGCLLVEGSAGGEVWCWGADDVGQMGDGTTTPDELSPVRVTFSDPTAVPVEVSAARGHNCARMESGEVWCWGMNNSGEIGLGSTSGFVATPTRVPGLTGVTDLAAGGCHTCVVRTNAGATDVACWGCADRSQCGPGAASPFQTSPITVTAVPAGSTLGLGDGHTCVLDPSGVMSCWGNNNFGQLGDGGMTNRATPMTVAGLPSIAQIAAGQLHTCARTTAGEAYCWGSNMNGELGDGSPTNRPTPAIVPGLSDVADLAAFRHTCAVQSTGAVYCWGPNGGGLLGDGTATDRPRPTLVWGL